MLYDRMNFTLSCYSFVSKSNVNKPRLKSLLYEMQIRKTYLEKGKSKLRILGVFCSRNKDLYVQKDIKRLL